MKLKSRAIVLLIGALCSFVLSYSADAQTYVKYVEQYELTSRTAYSDSVLNLVSMPSGVAKLDNYPLINVASLEVSEILQQGGELLKVWVCGTASPDGPLKENTRIAGARADAAADYIKAVVDVPEHKILKENHNEDWFSIYRLVQENDVPCKYDVLFIIRTMQGEERKAALKKLDDGKVWDYLVHEIFPQVRGVRFAFFCKKGREPEKQHVIDTVYIRDTVVIVKEVVYMGQPAATQKTSAISIIKEPRNYELKGSWYAAVKTDVATDILAVPQLGVEVQLSEKLSLDLMGWFSQWTYINPCDEYKVYGFRPELRYWVNGAMSKGLFFGLHANVAWYTMMSNKTDFYQNASLCTDTECSKSHFYQYTYQNSEGVNVTNLYHDTPAWSAGLTAGYSLSLDKSDRWAVEFVAGVGYAHYEQNWYQKSSPWSLKSVEAPQVKDYFGITRAGVNLSYRFPVRK